MPATGSVCHTGHIRGRFLTASFTIRVATAAALVTAVLLVCMSCIFSQAADDLVKTSQSSSREPSRAMKTSLSVAHFTRTCSKRQTMQEYPHCLYPRSVHTHPPEHTVSLWLSQSIKSHCCSCKRRTGHCVQSAGSKLMAQPDGATATAL